MGRRNINSGLPADSPVAFPGFGPLMPWWDMSDGLAVMPMHLCEIVLACDPSFPHWARGVALYLTAIRMGRD